MIIMQTSAPTDASASLSIRQRAGWREIDLVVPMQTGEALSAFFRRACAAVPAGATILWQQIFGLAPQGDALRQAFGAGDWPVTWLTEGMEAHPRAAGMIIHAVDGVAVQRILRDGRGIGSYYDTTDGRYCLLGDLRDIDLTHSCPEQARAVFGMMEAGLQQADMDFSHTVRTWYWNHRLLDWYAAFNEVRTSFFQAHHVFDGLVPASTGIGGSNAAGAALTAGLRALRPHAGVAVQAIPSPLQCPALQYGSSFSRAAEIAAPDCRWLTISGTASIFPDGRSAYLHDIDAQIALTMQVAGAILTSRGMSWEQVTRGIVYVKHARDIPAFQRYCARAAIPALPVVVTNMVVCRDDLLFEIEMDACEATVRG